MNNPLEMAASHDLGGFYILNIKEETIEEKTETMPWNERGEVAGCRVYNGMLNAYGNDKVDNTRFHYIYSREEDSW